MHHNLKSHSKITILIPLHNEEGNIVPIFEAVQKAFTEIEGCNYEIFFVNDGSTDNSLAVIKKLEQDHSNLYYLSFSRNFGKDAALLAGFRHIKCDAVITIDADLQHPPELIPTLIEQWRKGYDIVYTYRKEKNEHTGYFSQLSSKLFYKIVSKLADIELENGLSDFKLIDNKVLKEIKKLEENQPFFRAIFKWVGYNQKGIPYIVNPRINGQSKYSARALIQLALHSIVSFSTKPLLIAIYLGFFTSMLSILYIPYVLYSLFKGYAISGWPSTIATIVFFGSMQLMVLGIIGLYLGKIYTQVKNRPQYIITESNLKSTNPLHEKSKSMDLFR